MNRITHLQALYESSLVQRWHTMPHITDASLAKHQWGATMLILTLNPDPSLNLVRATMQHDFPERWSGDIPSPARNTLPDTLGEGDKQMQNIVVDKFGGHLALSKEEWAWLKFADSADALIWARQEQMMGNMNIAIAVRSLSDVLSEMGREHASFLGEAVNAVFALSLSMQKRLSDYIEEVE